MKLEAMHIGMQVRHPQYGLGVVKGLSETLVEIQFPDGRRSIAPEVSGLAPAEPQAAVSELTMPLGTFVRQVAETTVDALGIEKPESAPSQLAGRWHRGRMLLHPADPSAQPKEVPLEVFFHKIIGVRNQLRVLEQKINAHEKLSDGEKVDFQQYITRCYGSLTTFNLLFKEKEDQF